MFEIRIDTRKFPVVINDAVLRFRSVTLTRTQRRDKDLKELIAANLGGLSTSELLAYLVETSVHTNVLLFQPYFRQAMNISERTIDEEMLLSLVNAT